MLCGFTSIVVPQKIFLLLFVGGRARADVNHLRGVPWEDIFKLGASAAAREFCEWVQVGIDLYIPHRKCQVKPHYLHGFKQLGPAVIETLFSFVPKG